jgi:AraC-like DNA-binding protein
MNNGKSLIEALSQSKIYQDYERAFSEATALPLALRPVESWQLPHHRKRAENPFCALLSSNTKACSACLQVQQRLAENAKEQPFTATCLAGLSDTAVPVRLGDQLVGFLHTGQIFRRKPTDAQFNRMAQLASDWGVTARSEELKTAYFKTPVLPSCQHDSVIKLLSIFAEHLSILANQLCIQTVNAEPPVITRAKEFIRERQAEDLSLEQVAKAVNTSTFYFCKRFKQATGLTFTEYLSRLRIERAKNLLLNPNLRISEIAYEVGFQSLTHFNRVFRKITGQAPTHYRLRLARK